MTKELVISVIIVILITFGDVITLKYTNESIEESTFLLGELRGEITKEDDGINKELCKKKIDQVQKSWDKRHKFLSYYIEHDELEKAETDIAGLKGYIEKEEFTEALSELDRTVYVLIHIKNKNILNLENIF